MLKLEHHYPKGKMVLRTLAMPSDTNVNGNIFGGWIMSQMDIGGSILAKKIARGRVVTVQVNNITFLKPISVGDVVSCYAKFINIGTSSITINIEIWIKKVSSEPLGVSYCTTKAVFIYVAVNHKGKSRPIPFIHTLNI